MTIATGRGIKIVPPVMEGEGSYVIPVKGQAIIQRCPKTATPGKRHPTVPWHRRIRKTVSIFVQTVRERVGQVYARIVREKDTIQRQSKYAWNV